MKKNNSRLALGTCSPRLLLSAISLLILTYGTQAHALGARPPKVSTTKSTTTKTVVVDNTTTTTTTTTNKGYSYLDPDHEVPQSLLNKTLTYFENNKSKIKNKDVIGIIDFKQHNSKERFYIVDMVSGKVDKYLVAHGKNSDPGFNGYATLFSNTPGSEMSSQGFYLTAETYEGSHGLSLALDGLSTTNSNARARAIVIHTASYVAPGSKIGRSWGCPAVEPRFGQEIIDRLKNGAIIYAE